MIVIGGTVAVGKSTVAKMIGDYYGSPVFYESVDDNPILAKFYADPKKWAFTLQMYFLQSRYKSIQDAVKTGNPYAVLDRSIYEDHLFTQMNYEHGNMEKEHFDTYEKILNVMLDEWNEYKKRPELFIYLRASFDTILKRMAKRGRDFELGADKIAYFKDLHSRYDDWVNKYYNASQVLVIDMDRYDVTIPEDRIEVMEIINTRLHLGETVQLDDTIKFYKFVNPQGNGAYTSPLTNEFEYRLGENVVADTSKSSLHTGIFGYFGKDFERIPHTRKENLVLIELVAKARHIMSVNGIVCSFKEADVIRELPYNEYPRLIQEYNSRHNREAVMIGRHER